MALSFSSSHWEKLWELSFTYFIQNTETLESVFFFLEGSCDHSVMSKKLLYSQRVVVLSDCGSSAKIRNCQLPGIITVLPVYDSFSHHHHFDKYLKAEGCNVYIISSAGNQSSISCRWTGNKHTQGKKVRVCVRTYTERKYWSNCAMLGVLSLDVDGQAKLISLDLKS